MIRKNDIDERVKELNEDFERRAESRRLLERNWLLNINYFNGNQYAEILPTGEISSVDRKYFWQEENVFNHIAPIVESRLAKLNKIKAEVSCLPSSNDACDVSSAEFSTRLLRSVKENNGFKKLVEEATFWAEITGTAFYKIGWSKDKGMCISAEQGIFEGDVDLSVCPPYEIYPDKLTAKDVNECMSIIHARAYPVEVAERTWGVKLNPTKINVYGMSANELASKKKQLKSNDCEVDGHVLVLERYSLPTKDEPNGRLLIVAGEKVLYDGDLPYINLPDDKRGFPFVRQVSLLKPGAFYGGSLIERLIPVQRAYNSIKNRKHEFFNRMTAGVLLAEDGSVDTDNLEEDGISPGKVILYRQGCSQPQMLNFGEVPSEFGEEEEKLLKEFVSVSGETDFLINDIYKGNISGTTLNLLIEQDNNRMSVTAESIRNAVKAVSEKILRLYKQYAENTRLQKISGENGVMMLTYFKSNDISADNIVFDLDEEQVSTISDKRGLISDVVGMGLLSGANGEFDESTRRKILKLLGLEINLNIPSIDELQKNNAIKENNNLSVKVPKICELDDHNIHIEEHLRFALSGDSISEEDKIQITKHIAEHKNALKQQI